MKTIVTENYDSLSIQAANALLQIALEEKRPLICAASGDTPTGMYKVFYEKISTDKIDISDWSVLSLDEWIGLNGEDQGSCRYHLNNQLLNHLPLRQEQIIFFDGRAADPDAECARMESYIAQASGIDICILGLGMNGHLGMNEPGTPVTSRSHISDLDPTTKEVGQKYFSSKQVLTKGITLGMQTIMDAKHIILMASGEKKAAIVKQMLEGPVTIDLPGSIIRNHPSCTLFLDKAAAQFLSNG